MIALALASKPKLLIADEPTTALDVTTQAQILKLLRRFREEHGVAVLLVSHDFGVIAETCDRVLVMYGGHVVETADIAAAYKTPQHPYTQALLASIPAAAIRGPSKAPQGDRRPTSEPGEKLPGCIFEPRCSHAQRGLHPDRHEARVGRRRSIYRLPFRPRRRGTAAASRQETCAMSTLGRHADPRGRGTG